MKTLVASLVLCCAAVPALAQKDCESLKSTIAAKLDGKGVKKYQLDVVPTDDKKEGRVVGACDRGKMKIVYTKAGKAEGADKADAKPEEAAPKKPKKAKKVKAEAQKAEAAPKAEAKAEAAKPAASSAVAPAAAASAAKPAASAKP